MSKFNQFEKIFIMIETSIPKNNILNGLMMFVRIIPLFLITHDWNIHYQYSISYYISLTTFLPLIHKTNAQLFSLGFILILFIYSIINIIIYVKFYKQLIDFNKISNPLFFKFGIKIMYFINFIFSPYIFMFCVENYFCEPIYDETVNYKLIKAHNNNCRDIKNILILIIQSYLILYCSLLNILFSCITPKPCSLSSSLIITKLNEIKFKLVYFPFFQIILVFDYYLPLKICVIIKGVVRMLYIYYFFNLILNENKNFYTNFYFRLSILYIDSMCFFSCIIEYFFLFDYKNNFEYLQKNGTIIIFKLLIEGILAFILILNFLFNEKRVIMKVFNGIISQENSYELFNKIFFIFYHPEKTFGTDILYEIIENFDNEFKIHILEKKCNNYPGIRCYCSNCSYQDFINQSENFLNVVNDIRNGIKYDNKILKNEFPIIYKYIENLIKIQLIQNKSYSKNEFYYLVLVFFYIMFDKNYNKGLFYLEEFSTTKLYKTHTLIQLQCKIIKLEIFEDYQKNLIRSPDKSNKDNYESSFKEIYKIYSKVSEVVFVENNLSEVIKIYIKLLKYLKEKDCSLPQFIKLIKSFNKSMKKMNKTLLNLFLKNITSSYHLCAKLSLFYSFFYSEMPKNINKCFKNIFEITCKVENYSTIILDISIEKKNWEFIFKYLSDKLCFDLEYNLDFLKKKLFIDFNPENLRKCYNYNIIEKIRLGNNKIILKEIIFINKKNHAILYDLIGIVVFKGDKLQLFFKGYPYKFTYKIDNREYSKKINYENKEECYVFLNKKGKIFAISRLFEKYFCLTLHSIRKYKLNLFKDILKIEYMENKKIIKKNLAQVFDNISFLSYNLMQNSSNEEFSNIYKKIKDLQKLVLEKINSNLLCFIEKRELDKNKKETKNYFFVCFYIEFNKELFPFESFFGKNLNPYLIFPSKAKIGDYISTTKKAKKQPLQKFEINHNQNEVLIKIRQIQILTIKQLLLKYNIKINESLNLNEKEEEELNSYNNIVKKETNRMILNSTSSNISLNNNTKNKNEESIDHIEKFFSNNQFDNKFKKIKKNNICPLNIQINFQITIWILLTLTFIFLQTIILHISNKHIKKIIILSDILKNSLTTRNMIYTFISSLIRMQYSINKLQNDKIIDNGYTNEMSFHKQKILDRAKDFLFFFKIFERQQKYLSDFNIKEAINIYYQELDYISVKSDNLIIKHSLNSILANSHLHAFQVIENDIEPFFFNISYLTIENRELLKESAFLQFVFDNYFCNGKYTWDEVDNIIYNFIEKESRKEINIIILISSLCGFLYISTFGVQIYFYIKLNDKIFGKYFLNYNYLQYFNSLLLKKVDLIQKFIDNSNILNLCEFSQVKLTFENKVEDNLIFKNNYIRINNKMSSIIKAYKIKEIASEDIHIELNKCSTLFLTTPSINQKLMKKETDSINNNDNKTCIYNNKSVFSPIITKREFNNKKIQNNKNKKNKNHKRISNNSSINNLNKSNVENSLNLLAELNKVNNKKELLKPKDYINYFIFLLISVLLLTIFCIINMYVINKTFKTRIIFVFTFKSLIETINDAINIFLVYAITLLKGEPIIFSYKSNGYLSLYKELDYMNKITEHNILEEIFIKSDINTAKFFGLLTIYANKFKFLGDYVNQLSVGSGCKYFVNYYFENKNNSDFSYLNVFNYDSNDLIKQCENVSNGINNQGLTLAANNLINSLRTNYFEFKEDNHKGENLLKRCNDEVFVGSMIEIDLIYDKFIINLIICWTQDLDIVQTNFDNLNYFIFGVIIFLIGIIFIFYMIFFPIKILKEKYIIEEAEFSYYNTIMF